MKPTLIIFVISAIGALILSYWGKKGNDKNPPTA
jgi:hypothetical protein